MKKQNILPEDLVNIRAALEEVDCKQKALQKQMDEASVLLKKLTALRKDLDKRKKGLPETPEQVTAWVSMVKSLKVGAQAITNGATSLYGMMRKVQHSSEKLEGEVGKVVLPKGVK